MESTPIRTVEELVRFNVENADTELPPCKINLNPLATSSTNMMQVLQIKIFYLMRLSKSSGLRLRTTIILQRARPTLERKAFLVSSLKTTLISLLVRQTPGSPTLLAFLVCLAIV